MAFAGGLQQTPRTKWLFSKVVICANRPIPRSVSVEGATGKVALLKCVVHLQEVCGQSPELAKVINHVNIPRKKRRARNTNTVKAEYLLNTNHFEIPRHYDTNTTSYCYSEIHFNIYEHSLEFILTRFDCIECIIASTNYPCPLNSCNFANSIHSYRRDTVSAANPIIIVRKVGGKGRMHHEYALDADSLSNRETLSWSWLTPTELLVN